jgi:RNase P/RNase MRP subunit p29
VLDVNANVDADYSASKAGLQVSDLIGRAVLVYLSTDLSQVGTEGAVIAQSAGVGRIISNYVAAMAQ